MSNPCENCLCLPICKNRLKRFIKVLMFSNSLRYIIEAALSYKCCLVKEYLEGNSFSESRKRCAEIYDTMKIK